MHPTRLLAAAFLAACTACATAPQAAAPPRDAAALAAAAERGEPKALARHLMTQLAQEMLARADRVTEVEEHRQGLGGILTHVDLYEAPVASPLPGLCEVTVHDVAVGFLAPTGAPEGPPQARSVRTLTRYYPAGSAGSAGGGRESGAGDRARCAALPSKAFFDAPSAQAAQEALALLDAAQGWLRTAPAALRLSCSDLGAPCADPAAAFAALDPRRLESVSQVACAPGAESPGPACTHYRFAHENGPGAWTATIRGPRRPLDIDLRREQMPVS